MSFNGKFDSNTHPQAAATLAGERRTLRRSAGGFPSTPTSALLTCAMKTLGVFAALLLSACATSRPYAPPADAKTTKFTLVANSRDFIALAGVYYGDAKACLDFQQFPTSVFPGEEGLVLMLAVNREHSIGIQANISSRFSGVGQATFVHCNHYVTFPVAEGYEYRYENATAGGMCIRDLKRRSAPDGPWEHAPFRLRTLAEYYSRLRGGPACVPE